MVTSVLNRFALNLTLEKQTVFKSPDWGASSSDCQPDSAVCAHARSTGHQMDPGGRSSFIVKRGGLGVECWRQFGSGWSNLPSAGEGGSDFGFLTLGASRWMASLAGYHVIYQSIPIQHRTLCSRLKKSNEIERKFATAKVSPVFDL